MEALLEEYEKLSRKGNLSKSLEDVQKTIDLLVKARDSIAASTFHSLSCDFLGRILRNMLIMTLRPEWRFSDTSKAPEPCQTVVRGHQRRPEGCLQRTGQLFKSIGQGLQHLLRSLVEE